VSGSGLETRAGVLWMRARKTKDVFRGPSFRLRASGLAEARFSRYAQPVNGNQP